MSKYKTKTLWIIAIASCVCFLISPLLATPFGTLADNFLLTRFAEQWPQSHDPDLVWTSLVLGEQIFTFTTLFIAFVALVCGLFAARVLYQRKKNNIL